MSIIDLIDQRLIEYRQEARKKGEPVLRDKSFELLLETIFHKKPNRILEIGVNVGYSGISMLQVCKTAHLSGIEIDDEKIEIAKQNYKLFGVEDRAKIFRGDASEVIPILSGSYDFIFLDGPKGHYYEYLPNLLSILEVGGILFADNVLFRGYVNGKVQTPRKYNTLKNNMVRFLDAISNDNSLKTKIYDIEDGVSITQKLK